ncbi:MFS transporter [Actinocatenispora thailandica]|uniref:MFS transporter n=1 Tax=Actinocatenispora thailandica TaxID=227318 RepID=A0A7R7HZW5_9ACTN|nr:MFS transporter [Actinocatenispora thailandica]BCJ38703.1 MFS transporter [Actinocatenispora thailandica]
MTGTAAAGSPDGTAASRADSTAGRRSGGSRTRTTALAVICAAQTMFLLDTMIVTVALPHIQTGLGFSGPELSWVITAYALVFGGLLLLGSRCGDVFGRRRVFVFGLVLFTVASLTAGLAQAPWQLIASRAAQAAGAAAASPATLSLLATTFPEGPARNRAISIYTALGTAGGGIGLLAGGLIASLTSWRWIMLVNVPFGILVAAAAPRVLSEARRQPGRFDVPGALTGTAGMTMLVFGLTRAATDPAGTVHWTDPVVLASVAAAVLLLGLFVLVEWRSGRPLLPLRLFAGRARAGNYLAIVSYSMAMTGIAFFLTLFLQRIWHYSPLRTALVFLPMTALLVACSRASGPLLRRVGTRTVALAGLAVAAVGVGWLSLMGVSGGYLSDLLVPSSLTYAGLGVAAPPMTVEALASIGERDAGIASGVFNCARQLGGAVGLALLGSITWTTVAAHRRLPASHALAIGIDRGFLVAAGLVVLALAATVAGMPGRRPPGS